MRGIVAELNGKFAIILTQDGSFRKIKFREHMTVGSEVHLNQPIGNLKLTRLVTKASAIAAVTLFALGIGYGAYSYTVPYSYVNVDINPSIELTVNIYDRIIKVEALNDDGKKLLNNQSLKNERLGAGVSQLLNTAVEQGYLKAENFSTTIDATEETAINQTNDVNTPIVKSGDIIENAVLFTVSSADAIKSGELKKNIINAASKELDRGSIKSEVLAGEASIKQRDDARKLGVTPGKLVLIEDAIEGKPELKLEDLKNAAVKDLITKARDKKASEVKQNDAKEKNKAENSDKDSINQDSKSAIAEQGAKKEQNTPLSQNQEKIAGFDISEEAAIKDMDRNNMNSKNNNDDNNDNNDKDNKDDRDDENNIYNKSNKNNNENQKAADILKHEKQQRQQLMDELLEQVINRKKDQDIKEQDKNQQNKTNSKDTKKSDDKSNTKKNSNDNTRQKRR